MARTPLLRAIQKHFRTKAVNLTRREFVAGTGLLLLGAALPKATWAATKNRKVIIVGGGIAGLSCALKLNDHGVKAMVYEASNRLGGRMFSNTGYWKEQQVSEWCGELIDTGHRTIRNLAKRFNLTVDNLIEAQPTGSEDTYYFDGHHYPKSEFDLDIEPVLMRVEDDLKASGYPTTFDSYTQAGKALDEMSVYAWIESRVPGGHLSRLGQLLDVAYAIEYGADTADQSALNLLYLLGYQPAHSDPAVFGESDEVYHIRGGNETLPRAIAQHLGMDRFVLGKKLTALKKIPGEKYQLTFVNNQGELELVSADAVVLALPFSVLREIDLTRAGFDALKHQAIQDLGMGRNGKTQLQFQERVWNLTGAWPGISNGSTYSDTGYQSSWEVTRSQAGTSGILNFYSGGSVSEDMRTRQPFTSAGNPQARSDAQTALQSGEPVYPGITAKWNGKLTQSLPHLSPLMRASYAYYRVGQYTKFGGHEGVTQGQVYFCGDHCSQDFQGFMEGAASEGERAAKELLK